MYIIAYTTLADSENEALSDWSTYETFEEAKEEYKALVDSSWIYSASICGVIESTDYSPAENNKI